MVRSFMSRRKLGENSAYLLLQLVQLRHQRRKAERFCAQRLLRGALGLALGGIALPVESRILRLHPLARAAPWAFRWFGRDHHAVLGALARVGWTSAGGRLVR